MVPFDILHTSSCSSPAVNMCLSCTITDTFNTEFWRNLEAHRLSIHSKLVKTATMISDKIVIYMSKTQTLIHNEAVFWQVFTCNSLLIGTKQVKELRRFFSKTFYTCLVADIQCCHLAGHLRNKSMPDIQYCCCIHW